MKFIITFLLIASPLFAGVEALPNLEIKIDGKVSGTLTDVLKNYPARASEIRTAVKDSIEALATKDPLTVYSYLSLLSQCSVVISDQVKTDVEAFKTEQDRIEAERIANGERPAP